MDRRLNSYNGKPLYEVGFEVWFIRPTADFLQAKPEDVIHRGRVASISIDPDDIQFWIQSDELLLVPCEYVHDSKTLARQFCIGRAIACIEKHLKTLEGDIKYAQSQISAYTKKREKLYQQLKEECDGKQD